MSKSQVYYSENNYDSLLGYLPKLYGQVGLKVHVGEPGNTTYLPAIYAKKVYRQIKNSSNIVNLIECNVLYRGSRTNATDHIKTADNHGFGFAKLDILDGEDGSKSWKIDIKKKHFSEILVGAGLKEYRHIVIVSHFKGHSACGFGGSLKNLGMGLGSRAGKMAMHAAFDLNINTQKCLGCGICAKKCDAEAIKINHKQKAEIDFDKCLRCAGCIANCPQGAVEMPWGGTSSEGLQERIAEYCYGITQKVKCDFYINAAVNITARCDCAGVKMSKISRDIGFLASTDPVALDQASYDLVSEKNHKKDIFKQASGVDGTHILKYAEKLHLGSTKYEITTI